MSERDTKWPLSDRWRTGEVDHHWDPTWLHQGEYVIQLQRLRQQRRAMCPLRWGRRGDKKPKATEWWRQEPQSGAQINTWNQAANNHDNSRVSERKHFVKQTVCCLIAVFSHLHSLSQQLSLMWRWSGLGCSGHFVVVVIFCCSIKTESFGEGTWRIRTMFDRHLAYTFSGIACFALERCPYWKKLTVMLPRWNYSQLANVSIHNHLKWHTMIRDTWL